MAATHKPGGWARERLWRLALWGSAAAVLLAPLIAMQFTDEVAWTALDFAVFGTMLFAACGAYELVARLSTHIAYRAGVAVAIVAGFILVWMNLAVGIIGDEDNPANLMYGGVLLVGVSGALIGRFRPGGMAKALVATAVAQIVVAVVALVAGLGYTFILTGFFVALWLTSARLFRKAATG